MYITCKICERNFKNFKALGVHLSQNHKVKSKNYYDEYLKKENNGICLYCGKETNYTNLNSGYNNYCSIKCVRLDEDPGKRMIKTKLTNLRKYGSEWPTQNKEIIIKIKQTNLKKYGVENSFEREDIKEKCKKIHLKKLGVENPSQSDIIKKKKEKTSLMNYGVKNPNQSDKIKEKKKQTCLKKYGVEYTHQNREILNKSLKTRRLLKQFKNTNLTYQGSYELDFLEKFYNKIDIENGPSVSYLFEGKNKVYHSDFYISSMNLIVEIKSSYILTLDESIKEKKQACLDQGYNYIMILDKNYKDFNI